MHGQVGKTRTVRHWCNGGTNHNSHTSPAFEKVLSATLGNEPLRAKWRATLRHLLAGCPTTITDEDLVKAFEAYVRQWWRMRRIEYIRKAGVGPSTHAVAFRKRLEQPGQTGHKDEDEDDEDEDEEKPRKSYCCRTCGLPGHDSRQCPCRGYLKGPTVPPPPPRKWILLDDDPDEDPGQAPDQAPDQAPLSVRLGQTYAHCFSPRRVDDEDDTPPGEVAPEARVPDDDLFLVPLEELEDNPSDEEDESMTIPGTAGAASATKGTVEDDEEEGPELGEEVRVRLEDPTEISA